jgi:hypothetical protein
MTLQEAKAMAYEERDHEVRRQLTDDDLNLLRQDLEASEIHRDRVRTEKEETMKSFKAEFDGLNKKRRSILDKLRQRFRDESHPCYVVANYQEDTIEFWSKTTGQCVDSRPMKPSERQLQLRETA